MSTLNANGREGHPQVQAARPLPSPGWLGRAKMRRSGLRRLVNGDDESRWRLEGNKDLVRRLFDHVFNDRDLDLCDEIFATDYVEHAIAPFGREEPGAVVGPEHMRNVVTWLVDQYPDMTMRIESIASEGDTVAVLVWSEGTNLGKLNGVIPPTGKRFAGRQSHWYRVEGGKLAEHWAVREDLGTMLQLGILNLPGPPP